MTGHKLPFVFLIFLVNFHFSLEVYTILVNDLYISCLKNRLITKKLPKKI